MTDTGYRDSFRKLGYDLESVRQDWSAENENGICLSLWSKEMQHGDGLMELDTTKNCGPIENWSAAGKNKRLKHLISAWNNHSRWVDVVIRKGNSWDVGVPSNAWDVEKRRHKFRLQTLDIETGHFSIKLMPFPE